MKLTELSISDLTVVKTRLSPPNLIRTGCVAELVNRISEELCSRIDQIMKSEDITPEKYPR